MNIRSFLQVCAQIEGNVGVVVYRSSRPTRCLKQVSLRGFQCLRDSCMKFVSLLLSAPAHPSELLDLCAFNYPACFMSCLFVFFFFQCFFFALCVCVRVCVCCRLCPSPFSSSDHAADSEKRDFFMLEPSEESNGCFLAVLGRVVSIRKHTMFTSEPGKSIFSPFRSRYQACLFLPFALSSSVGPG